MNNLSDRIPSMSQFEENVDNLLKLADERDKDMDNVNQSLTNVVNNDYNDNINSISERMNQDSSAIASPREEERLRENRNHDDNTFINEFNDNQITISTPEDQKSSGDTTLPQAEQITNVLIDINKNQITSNNIFSSNNEIVKSCFICNNSGFSKPKMSPISDNTNNIVSEHIVLDNYPKIRNGNDLISSYIDKDSMEGVEIQQGEIEIRLEIDNVVDKDSTNNGFNNDERKEITDQVKQEYGRIILALKNQLTLYNKFREVIPEYIRKPVENKVGVISFIYHQPNQTDGVYQTIEDSTKDKSIIIPQENDSDFLSSTESNYSEQNQEVKKSARTGYNYFIRKQFKKSKNESRKAQDIIKTSAKRWLELPANKKKHYELKAKLRQEKRKLQPRQPRIDTPGKNESEILAVVIPINR